MSQVSLAVVFNIKKEATPKNGKTAPVYVRITFERKIVYVSTGVRVQCGQWDAVLQRVKDSVRMDEQNAIIEEYLKRAEKYRLKCLQDGVGFSLEGAKRFLTQNQSASFVEFMEERIRERRDISDATKKQHISGLNALKGFGRMEMFSELTLENVARFDDYLHAMGLKQTTIYTRHKIVKSYINEAIRFEKIGFVNPYSRFRALDRGQSEEGRYLTEDDMKAIARCKLPSVLEKVRDLMVVQYYTGLSYSDLMAVDFRNRMVTEGVDVVVGRRVKTGVEFFAPLLKPTVEVLERRGWELPKMTQQQLNMRIKEVCMAAGIRNGERVASHWLRRGAGMYMLNHGVPMEVVSKVLGHSSVRQTESVYAKLLPETVGRQLAGL